MLSKQEKEQLDKILAAAVSSDELSEWEDNFVNDMIEKLEELGEDMRISDKQWEILQRIEGKVL